MMKMPHCLLRGFIIACLPLAANAAGTYYNSYASPQAQQQVRYNTPSYSANRMGNMYQNTGYRNYNNGTNSGYATGRYWTGGNNGWNTNGQNQAQPQSQTARPAQQGGANQTGFYADAGLSYQNATWSFEMKDSGSKLHYDNINWYVFDLSGGYKFNAGNIPMQVMAGLQYGIQGADSTMVDDDITNGGYISNSWCTKYDADGNCINYLGDSIGHTMSIGTNSGGSMLGVHAGFGLTDFWKWGNMRVTPSIGYRYLNYKLKTKKNYGMSIDTWKCFEFDGGHLQCDPVVIFYNKDANGNWVNVSIPHRENWDGSMDVPTGTEHFETGDTYYFELPNVSHSYKVNWSGPYVALDMDYVINNNNTVSGRVELGLPAYTATGDQPYRIDWAHPKSVEDKGGFGDAYHFGLTGTWVTALSDTVSLSLGVTYDYYTVSGADATTYYNADRWNGVYADLLQQWQDNGRTEAEMLDEKTGDDTAIFVNYLRNNGWKTKQSGEIDSFYKSLGLRAGLRVVF